MAMNWPTFYARLGSSIVFVAIMLTGLLWNDGAFLILVSLIQVACMHEYFKLMTKIHPETFWPGWLGPVMQVIGLLFLILFAELDMFIQSKSLVESTVMPVLLMLAPVTLLLIGTLSRKNFLSALLQAFGAIFYIIIPAIMLISMRQISILVPIALILMIWINDTMAYLVGSFIGKTPLSDISPHKTWEGTIGGVILTIAAAATWGYYTPYYHMMDWMALAFFASLAGNLGDLLESKLKRMADVKDSGALMPGHGGALDRFDSLLITVPFAYCYALVFMPPLPLVIF